MELDPVVDLAWKRRDETIHRTQRRLYLHRLSYSPDLVGFALVETAPSRMLIAQELIVRDISIDKVVAKMTMDSLLNEPRSRTRNHQARMTGGRWRILACLATSLAIGPNTAGAASPVPTASIETLQIGISVEKNGLCPRKAVMKVWARTAGPGKARFVIEGQNGTRTGQLSATAVKNSAGVWLATYTRNITIQTDIATRYRASGDGKASAWAPLLAKCGPQVRHNTTTSGSTAEPSAKDAADVGKGGSKTPGTTTSAGKPPVTKPPATKPASQTKKAGGTGQAKKITPQCRSETMTVTRYGAVAKKTGKATAWIAWSHNVTKKWGSGWSDPLNAKNRSESCIWKGTYTCRVSARPCRY